MDIGLMAASALGFTFTIVMIIYLADEYKENDLLSFSIAFAVVLVMIFLDIMITFKMLESFIESQGI